MTGTKNRVTVSRVVKASPEAVYAAWTDPDIMRRWMATEVDADVRVGGRYRITIHEADGTINSFTGEYRVLEPGKRLVKTFRHHSAKPGEYEDETVEVTFQPAGPGQTTVTVRNAWTGAKISQEQEDGVREGFEIWLNQLEAVLE